MKLFSIDAYNEDEILFNRDFESTDRAGALTLAYDVAYFILHDKGMPDDEITKYLERTNFDVTGISKIPAKPENPGKFRI